MTAPYREQSVKKTCTYEYCAPATSDKWHKIRFLTLRSPRTKHLSRRHTIYLQHLLSGTDVLSRVIIQEESKVQPYREPETGAKSGDHPRGRDQSNRKNRTQLPITREQGSPTAQI